MGMVGSIQHSDIGTTLRDAKEFLFEMTNYTGLASYGEVVVTKETGLLTAQMAFTTSDVANYIIQLTFECVNPLMGTSLKSTELLSSFNRYGDWKSTAGVSVSGDYLTIPYVNDNVVV